MSIVDPDSADLMILRAWIEPDHRRSPLRVRVIQLSTGGTGPPVTSAAATVDDTCLAVRAWLEQLLSRERPDPPAPQLQ